jgi:hypothetical protein
MFARVSVRGLIAAPRATARLTGTEMNPPSARLHAIFTLTGDGLANGRYCLEMSAGLGHWA